MDNVNVIRTGFFAPDFSLPDARGDIFHLKDNLRDKFICLCFFPDGGNEKANNCLKELNQGLPKTPAGLPVDVVGICPERISHVAQLRERLKLAFPILADDRLAVATKYHLVNTSSAKPAVYFSVFVIDDTNLVRYRASEIPGLSKYSFDELKSEIAKLI